MNNLNNKNSLVEVTQQSLIDTIKDTQVKQTLEAINRFQAIVKTQFKENHHYGIIPGTGKKPTLLKPGAEVIVTLLGLSVSYEILNCTRDFNNEFFDYMIKCVLKKNGESIAEGLGSANTHEKKFKRAEGEGAGMDNNVLKMAKKRALVDAALNVGSLSDVFTQDFDDDDLKDLTGASAEKNTIERSMEQPITQQQAKRMFAIANGKNDVVKSVLGKYGYNASADVLKKDYDKICAEIESGANEK